MLELFKRIKKNKTDNKSGKSIRADFNYHPSIKIRKGNVVEFENQSVHASTFVWNFGNGNIATDENPKQVFSNSGEYKVSLIAMSDEGSDSMSKKIMVL